MTASWPRCPSATWSRRSLRWRRTCTESSSSSPRGPLHAHVQLAGVRYLAAVADVPPYRLLTLRGFPTGARIRDTRLTMPSGTNGPPPRTLGPVPAGIAGIADDARAELGLAALMLAGGDPGGPPWVLASGWADLDRACLHGRNWGRITGTVLFALSTVDTLVGLTAPIALAVKLWGALVWLIALTAIVLLWRRSSSAFFKATPA